MIPLQNDLPTALLAEMLREALANGDTPRLMVVSGSMLPLLRVGDEVMVSPCSAQQLQRGDIIVLQAMSALYTHRYYQTVIHNGKPHLLTRGDRPLAFDPLWAEPLLVGRVVGRVRHDKTLSLTAGQGKWFNTFLTRWAEREARWFSLTASPVNENREAKKSPLSALRYLSLRIIRRILLLILTLLEQMIR